MTTSEPPPCIYTATRQQLEDQYAQMTSTQLADYYGTYRGAVTRRLREVGIKVRPRGRPPTTAPPKPPRPNPLEAVPRAQLDDEYQRMTIQEIAGLHKAGTRTVKTALQDAGIPLRKPGEQPPKAEHQPRPPSQVDRVKLHRLWLEGCTKTEMKRLLGCGHPKLLRELRATGLEPGPADDT